MRQPDASGQAVSIVDDDEAFGDSVAALLASEPFTVRVFRSADAFLRDYRSAAVGCVLADLRMPGMDGFALLAELARRSVANPVIVMTGHGDVPLAVRAMRSGAFDFIEKPFSRSGLLVAVDAALRFSRERRESDAARSEFERNLQRLTEREREVYALLVDGCANKEVARVLSLSPRTVEVHRARVMEKLQVESFSQLVRLGLALKIKPGA